MGDQPSLLRGAQKMNYSDLVQHILDTNGISLQSVGVKEIGLTREDALKLVEVLRVSSIPILGGDVYLRKGDSLELAFANWYSDRRPGESQPEFAERSSSQTKAYIEAFPESREKSAIFAIILERGNS